MKSPNPVSRHRLAVAIPAAVFTFVVLFSLSLLTEEDELPSCVATRSAGVDTVMLGVRPCVLRTPAGSGAAHGADSGHVTVPGSSGKTNSPVKPTGGAAKQPKTPAAPKAPAAKTPAAPKAPAAPAVKVPPVRR